MKRIFRRLPSFLAASLFLLFSSSLCARDWLSVERGVEYREFQSNGLHAYVARVELSRDDLEVIATNESEKGLVVSEFAERTNAIIAINADYFDEQMRTVGHARGSEGAWKERHGTRNQPVIGFSSDRAEIFRLESRESSLPSWVEHAVSGWPALIENCTVYTAEQLPGSDHFTRAPHPRTAVGLTEDGKTLYIVVADGRREGVPGPTLAELGMFMKESLGVCSALNLDGGGSTEMVVEGQIVNVPSDGNERVVANHIAVVSRPQQARSSKTKD